MWSYTIDRIPKLYIAFRSKQNILKECKILLSTLTRVKRIIFLKIQIKMDGIFKINCGYYKPYVLYPDESYFSI